MVVENRFSMFSHRQVSFILKIGCFSDHLPRCQALSADGLSLITWRVIGTKAQTGSFCFSALRQVMLA
jgi:hypothetical protein